MGGCRTGLYRRISDCALSRPGTRHFHRNSSESRTIHPTRHIPGKTPSTGVRRKHCSRYTACMLQLLVASSNAGKLEEFRLAANDELVRIDVLPALRTIPAPAEDGASFEENAILKAIYYSQFAPGQIVIADDSGLEVDALQGAPGIRSARFAADSGLVDSPDANDNTDVWNNIVLLQKLEGITQRTARYQCVLAAARSGRVLATAAGSVEGVILEAPHGTGGFGYDPLFYLPELDQTMADLDPAVKLSLSHRGRALEELLPQLL